MTLSNSSVDSDPNNFVLDLPQAHYRPLRIGIVGRKTKLEEILEKIQLANDQYIWYTDVTKTSRITNKSKECTLVLSTHQFYLLNKETNKQKAYFYQDIESIRPLELKENTFLLKFYKKDNNSKVPQKEISVTCTESEAFFRVKHVIMRQMPLNWQQFFETNIELQDPDCYQFHAYLLKVNRFGSAQPRFIVLTTIWMLNAKASFDKTTVNIKFEKLKWRFPLEALTKVTIKEQGDKFNLVIFSDLQKQNEILVKHDQKKIKKTERKFTFSNITTCRDFIFHLKRIYHLNNCAGPENQHPPLNVEVLK